MQTRKIFILISAVSLIFLSAGLSFSQEKQPTLEKQAEPEVQWVWGEVVSVDVQKNELLVKYLDYETETEKEVNINADDKTTYENIKSLIEIKPQDNVSIDYIVNPEGKNIAKNISVEKPENIQPLPEPEKTTEETPKTESAPSNPTPRE